MERHCIIKICKPISKNMTVKLSEISVFILMFFLTFQGLLEDVIPLLCLIDELSTLIFFSYGFFIWVRNADKKVSISTYFLLIGLVIFSACGWISTLIFRYQSIKISFLSYLLSCKYFISLLGCLSMVVYDDTNLLYGSIKRISRPMLIIIFLWQFTASVITAIPSINILSYCGNIIFYTSIIISDYRRKDVLYLFAGTVALILTGFSKSYGAAALLVAVFIWIIKFHKKVKVYEIALAAIAAIALVWDEVYYYYIYGAQVEFPRAMTLLGGAQVANNYFPVGTGWGTFGTYYAVNVYSPVYIQLGWENHYLLGRVNGPDYLMDNYWPSVYAEVGWIGFLSIIMFLAILFFCISKMYKYNKNIYAAGVFVFGFMLITTLESTSFAHPGYYILSIAMGIYMGQYLRIKKGKTEVCQIT